MGTGAIISDTRDCLLSAARSDSFSFIFKPVRGPSISENYSNAPGGRELRVPFNCAPVHDKFRFYFVRFHGNTGHALPSVIFVPRSCTGYVDRMIPLLISRRLEIQTIRNNTYVLIHGDHDSS